MAGGSLCRAAVWLWATVAARMVTCLLCGRCEPRGERAADGGPAAPGDPP